MGGTRGAVWRIPVFCGGFQYSGKVSGKTHKSGLQGKKAAQRERERRFEAAGPKEPRAGAGAAGKADQMAAWSKRYIEKRGGIIFLFFFRALPTSLRGRMSHSAPPPTHTYAAHHLHTHGARVRPPACVLIIGVTTTIAC